MMLKSKKYHWCKIVIGSIFMLLLFAGCSSRYTISSPKYDAYSGEVNQHVRMIDAPAQRIFEILTQPKGMKALCPDGTIVTNLSPPPYKAGDLVETRVDHIFKLKWISRVEAVEPNRMIRLKFQTGFFSGGTEIWKFEEEAEKKTRVSQTIIVEPKGLMKQAAWLLKVRRKHDRMVEQFLNNLELSAESSITSRLE
jgi:ribosome-associated toxin RatA of RatAB toxin-antitoxin module